MLTEQITDNVHARELASPGLLAEGLWHANEGGEVERRVWHASEGLGCNNKGGGMAVNLLVIGFATRWGTGVHIGSGRLRAAGDDR